MCVHTYVYVCMCFINLSSAARQMSAISLRVLQTHINCNISECLIYITSEENSYKISDETKRQLSNISHQQQSTRIITTTTRAFCNYRNGNERLEPCSYLQLYVRLYIIMYVCIKYLQHPST
ncbi:unnamed protein product [Ceratitis capitata]|uniref:(Mediterranean fruit fly) hypothetical protein n=1 Tax=Ceratitis capitata TaxID=7213 RepID=A0A811V682_CERCA|nr:unnamed protein product [Ceratitis capitata]